MKKKQILTPILVLALLLPFLPVSIVHAAEISYFQGDSYSTDYTTWRQTESPWSSLSLGDWHTMSGSGCFVSAISILMCHSGVYDPSSMNPGVLLLWLDSNGLISHSSDRNRDGLLTVSGLTSTLCPRFYYVSQAYYSSKTSLTNIVAEIKNLQSQGCFVIARVKNGGHYVAVAKTVGTTDARLYDSAYASKSLLSEYDGTITELIWFKANANGRDTITQAADQDFTVNSRYLTISYNANGGTVSPAEQLVTVGSAYDLPTPTRTDHAFFLGWYTSVGDLVTNTARVGSAGHTLTARWNTEGHAFTLSSSKATFRDVATSAWYYDSVSKVCAYGFMNGTSSSTFAPTENITAAQAVVIAARLHKLYCTGNSSFSSSKPWYYSYLIYALEENAIPRAPTDMDATLTRREFCWLISEALPEEALPAVNEVAYAGIADLYRSDLGIYDLYRAGVLSGTDKSGTFRPNQMISRAEVATILLRIADPNHRILFTFEE